MSLKSFWHHLSTVDKKRIQQALQMAKEALEKAGAPIEEEALRLASEISEDARFQQFTDRPDQIARAAIVAGVLQEVRENIDIPAERWDVFLQQMRQELPYGLRSGFRRGVNSVAKGLPKKPSTGRNEVLDTPEKRKKACDLVSKYERMGDSKRVAYAKAAKEMNCSARTIQRAWKSRAGQLTKKLKKRSTPPH
jgi:hypothetical protein